MSFSENKENVHVCFARRSRPTARYSGPSRGRPHPSGSIRSWDPRFGPKPPQLSATFEDPKDDNPAEVEDPEEKKDETMDSEEKKDETMDSEEPEQPSDRQDEWDQWEPFVDTIMKNQDDDDEDDDDDVEHWIESFQKMKDLFQSLKKMSQEVYGMCEESISRFKRLKRQREEMDEERERELEKRRKLDEEWAAL